MNIQKILKSKKWLNPDTTSFIFTELYREKGWWYGTCKLADCSRIINFDIDLENKKDKNRTIKKLDIMIKELMLLKETVECVVDV